MKHVICEILHEIGSIAFDASRAIYEDEKKLKAATHQTAFPTADPDIFEHRPAPRPELPEPDVFPPRSVEVKLAKRAGRPTEVEALRKLRRLMKALNAVVPEFALGDPHGPLGIEEGMEVGNPIDAEYDPVINEGYTRGMVARRADDPGGALVEMVHIMKGLAKDSKDARDRALNAPPTPSRFPGDLAFDSCRIAETMFKNPHLTPEKAAEIQGMLETTLKYVQQDESEILAPRESEDNHGKEKS
jgi:hypothetical protein